MAIAAAAAFWFVGLVFFNFLNQHPFIFLISRLFFAHLGFDARD